MKELLSHAGVPFLVRNVELDLDAYHELLARGFRAVPVTIVGDGPGAIAIRGFDDAALRKTLLDQK